MTVDFLSRKPRFVMSFGLILALFWCIKIASYAPMGAFSPPIVAVEQAPEEASPMVHAPPLVVADFSPNDRLPMVAYFRFLVGIVSVVSLLPLFIFYLQRFTDFSVADLRRSLPFYLLYRSSKIPIPDVAP